VNPDNIQKMQVVKTTKPVNGQQIIVVQKPKKRRQRRRNRRNRSRAQRRRQVVRLPQRVTLSKCTIMWARALSDPFFYLDNSDGSLPCIPSLPSRKTKREVAFVKRNFTITSNGAYYSIMVSPFQAANNAFNSLQYPPVVEGYGTNATVPQWPEYGTTNPVFATFPYEHNGSMTFQQVGAGIAGARNEFRTVGCGIRIRYTGANDTMAGRLILIQTPDHETVEGMQGASVEQYDQARTFPVSKTWTTLAYQPIDSDECEFEKVQSVGYTPGNPPTNAGQFPYPLGVLINSPSPASFEYQVVWIFEFVGPQARGSMRSEVDPVGFGATIASTGTTTGTKNPETTFANTVEKIVNNVAEFTGIRQDQMASAAVGLVGAGMAASTRSLQRVQFPIGVTPNVQLIRERADWEPSVEL
jgi:hypothetical protein